MIDEGIDASLSLEMMKGLASAGILRQHEIDGKCIILYGVIPELNQEVCLTEWLIYVIKEHRGSIRLLTKIKHFFEDTAREENCDCIKIGANFGYKDDSFSKLLERWGYVPDTYRKEL
jgi:hypothetical protein